MNTKICKRCQQEKPFSEFHKMQKSSTGIRNTCKQCRKIEKQEYSSKAEVKQKAAENYQKNKHLMRDRLNKYYWTLVSQFHQYLKSAKKRKIEWSLSKEDCELFYNKECHYCSSTYPALGIDRVDNTKGYTIDNCVPCCKKCNWMKRDMTKEEFIYQIRQIYKKAA